METGKSKRSGPQHVGSLSSAPCSAGIGSRFEQLKMEVRKGSMVNVNPTNTRPHSDTPEIRKYKKRFNSEILCAALWGERLPLRHIRGTLLTLLSRGTYG